ncbi:hypothetical protein GCM10010435_87810 [Winogradskya consettensis]|uniref:Diguanylate cyclase/phosphodiesterase n=1 Tax=Winogradskya consettensis TaxID=113560 RepID=A0A919T1J8_9ACTN|nr:hypothetical protein Aco04nite_74090 [Actinoplanes consettensis]
MVGAWVIVGLLVSVAYPFLRDGTPVAAFFYNSFTVATLAAIVAGVRRNRPVQRVGWFVFAGAVGLRLFGDVTYEVYRQILHLSPFPSLADAFYLAAFPLLVAGTLLVARGRLARDWAGILDATIISGGLSLVWWVFVIAPMAADASSPLLQRVIGAAYPALDLLLIALVAQLVVRSGRLTVSLGLLTVGMVTLLVSDVLFQFVPTFAPEFEGVVAVGWLLSNTMWGAAALDRSSRAPAPRAVVQARSTAPTLGRTRLALLTACTLLVPAVLFVQGLASGPGKLNWLAIGVGAVVLFLLVLARMSGFVVQVQRQAGQLEELALCDALTGLPNRRVFEERLAGSVAAGNAQVAILDLDGFKDVNDRLGHAVGDRLLAVVAKRLAGALREGDLVARMGGDEFAVLLGSGSPGAMTGSPGAMTGIVERLASALRKPVEAGGHELLIGASIGSADGTGTRDAGEVLRRADIAMYAAKAAGGGRHRGYSDDLDARAGEQAKLGAEIRAALDLGQFRVVYQPIVSLPDGRIVSVEALVRWEHPERGLISPAEFIPVAEQNGLIVELGAWILRTACSQAVVWRNEFGEAGPQRMSVNVSARQLAEPGFTALVAEVLAWTGLAAHQLIVEVTETAVFGGGLAVQAVKDLHELGVKIALDDFGTGHSSLGLLQTVPVDILKVDKSFVDTITMAGRHAVIATALIQVSSGLGLMAVAEGVETAEQAAELYRLGYRLAQGYHFGRPVAEPDFLGTRVAVG